eukprot:1146578-Pelagomonas_calceolata.AAC.2
MRTLTVPLRRVLLAGHVSGLDGPPLIQLPPTSAGYHWRCELPQTAKERRVGANLPTPNRP